jgi:predicted DNA repair protein MutK
VAALGHGLVKAMPRVLAVLTTVGIAAMLWVGGHILLVGSHELGLTFLYDAVHHLEEAVHEATGALGGVLAWLVDTAASALLGLLVGAVIVLVMNLTVHRLKARRSKPTDSAEPAR